MSREVHIAIIEDSKGTHHQFNAPTETELTGKITGWVRKKWKKAWGDQPDDADEAISEFFQKYALPPFVDPGWECELWRAEPVAIDDAPLLSIKGPGQPPSFTYPMELFINGELSFKVDTEDASGDLAAIKALMTMRTAKRDNRPLTNIELYGTDLGMGDVVRTDAYGNSVIVRGGKTMMCVSASPSVSIPAGAAVLIRRGGHVDPTDCASPSQGSYRDVKATYLGADPNHRHSLLCRLEQDDPYDTVGWSKKGDEGYWSASCVRLDPEVALHIEPGGED